MTFLSVTTYISITFLEAKFSIPFGAVFMCIANPSLKRFDEYYEQNTNNFLEYFFYFVLFKNKSFLFINTVVD